MGMGQRSCRRAKCRKYLDRENIPSDIIFLFFTIIPIHRNKKVKAMTIVAINSTNYNLDIWGHIKNPIGAVLIFQDEPHSQNQCDKICSFLNDNRYIAIPCHKDQNRLEIASMIKQMYQIPLFVLGDSQNQQTVCELAHNSNLYSGGVCVASNVRHMRPRKWRDVKCPLLIIGNKYSIWAPNMQNAPSMKFVIYPEAQSDQLINTGQQDILSFFNRAHMRG